MHELLSPQNGFMLMIDSLLGSNDEIFAIPSENLKEEGAKKILPRCGRGLYHTQEGRIFSLPECLG